MPKKPTNHDELMANMGLPRTRKQRRIAVKLYNYQPPERSNDENIEVPIQQEAEHEPQGIENINVPAIHGGGTSNI